MGIVHLSKSNYKEEIVEYKGLVLIDFWAPWCPPCRMIGPIIEEIADENDNIKVCKVNVDEENELAQLFQVSNIPLLVIMKDNNVINKSVGYKEKEEILDLLK